MASASKVLLVALCLIVLQGSLAAPARGPAKAPARGPSRTPAKAPPKAPAKAPTRAPAKTPTKAPVPAPRRTCPYTYAVKKGDTYCTISSKVGISIARLQEANPTIPTYNVTTSSRFIIPCKPEINCCPTYIVSANQGTGISDILKSRSYLTAEQLLAANSGNPDVSASYIPCGTEVLVPCKAGSARCRGVGYAPSRAPSRAPTALPTLRSAPGPTLPSVTG